MDAVKKIPYRGKTIFIYPDEAPDSPRAWDNMGTMACFHRRYGLGDKHELKAADFNSWSEVFDYIQKTYDTALIISLYLYDHSGISIKVGPFSEGEAHHAAWDSGQVGFIFVSKEKVRKELGVKAITKKVMERVCKILKGEVSTYDQYLRGDVYGYVIKDEDGEDVDSCWGFFGIDFCIQEAKEIVDWQVDEKPIRDEIKLLDEVEAIIYRACAEVI
jgi:hypothetical protein